MHYPLSYEGTVPICRCFVFLRLGKNTTSCTEAAKPAGNARRGGRKRRRPLRRCAAAEARAGYRRVLDPEDLVLAVAAALASAAVDRPGAGQRAAALPGGSPPTLRGVLAQVGVAATASP